MVRLQFGEKSRRIVLINVEHTVNTLPGDCTQYRIWPHLGILTVGTVACEEGWEVVLHDELIEGFVDLANIVQPGDIVGFSLVVTGMERGVELARQAKSLGARLCIAGNDSAIFRANQLLKLPDHPIDAVFTGNSLAAVREFLRQVEGTPVEQMDIPGVAVVHTGIDRTNESAVLRAEREMRQQLAKAGKLDLQDVFVVPRLDLYRNEYWQQVWQNYRTVFGQKHTNPASTRNALSLFAQGCTRTGTMDACSYCTIAGVADIRVPTEQYLAQVLEAYQSFGINYVFNTTDSVFEMRPVFRMLKSLGAFFSEGMMLYGRARGIARHPEHIEDWLSLTGGRLLLDVGMDSGDARILESGVVKSSQSGSRLEENRQAVRNIAASGAHLHYSLIFGSPGETRESCERSLEFFEWTRSMLGPKLDQCETDIYWLNHGSPASRVFHDYGYAKQLAFLARKEISHETWEHCFARHRDTLVVPRECEEAWYEHFTSISMEEAYQHVASVAHVMSSHAGAAPGRSHSFQPG